MADAVGLRASRGWAITGLLGAAGIALWAARTPNVDVIPPTPNVDVVPPTTRVGCASSLSMEPQDMCGPFASPSEVFGEGPQLEDFESIAAPPFDAVTVLTHGDAERADLSAHARVALVVRLGDAWWGVELGTTGDLHSSEHGRRERSRVDRNHDGRPASRAWCRARHEARSLHAPWRHARDPHGRHVHRRRRGRSELPRATALARDSLLAACKYLLNKARTLRNSRAVRCRRVVQRRARNPLLRARSALHRCSAARGSAGN